MVLNIKIIKKNMAYRNKAQIIEGTYSEIETLKNNDELIPSYVYYISDRDIWLLALTENQFALSGERKMRVIQNDWYTPQTISGFVDIEYLGIYGQTIAQGSVPNSIFLSGGTIYRAIWGGKMWERDETGADGGTTIQITINGGGWTQMALNNNDIYRDAYFTIEYNFDEDFVVKQNDWKGNRLYRNTNIGIGTIALDITDWGNENIYQNSCAGIFNNLNSGDINGNSNSGSIINNSNSGSINGNSNNGDINRNSNSGSINGNSNNGPIFSNSNSGNIIFNSNNGDINRNSNSGSINGNSNNGPIINNSNSGNIILNSSDSGTFSISSNKNNGLIRGNVSTSNIVISNNINNGRIGVTSGTINRSTSITDTIVIK